MEEEFSPIYNNPGLPYGELKLTKTWSGVSKKTILIKLISYIHLSTQSPSSFETNLQKKIIEKIIVSNLGRKDVEVVRKS